MTIEEIKKGIFFSLNMAEIAGFMSEIRKFELSGEISLSMDEREDIDMFVDYNCKVIRDKIKH